MRRALVVLLLIGQAFMARRSVSTWHSEYTLWSHAIIVSPCGVRPVMNLTKLLYGDGRVSEASALGSSCR